MREEMRESIQLNLENYAIECDSCPTCSEEDP